MKPAKEKIQKEIDEKTFKAFVENAHEGIVLYNDVGTIMYATSPVKRISGFSVSEVLGKKGTEFVHPDEVEISRDAFLDILTKPGKSVTLIQRLLHKKGHYYWSESILTNFFHVPHINGIVSNFRDITDKKLAEEKALNTQVLLEAITQNLSEGVYMGIVGGNFIYVNDALVKTLGYKNTQELLKIKPAHLYANKSEHKRIIEDLAEKSVLHNVEAEFYKKNGATFWGMVNVKLLPERKDEMYFVGTLKDINKEKEAAINLMESRNFLNSIIDTVAAPLFVKDEKHRWIIFNDAFCKLIGKSRDEIQGKTDKDFLPQQEAELFWKIDNKILKDGKTYVNEESITSKGTKRDLLTVKSLSVDEKGNKFIIGFITDVTEFKVVERKINQLNANLQAVMESTGESIFAIDKNFCYTSFNKNHKRVMKLLYKADIEVGTDKSKCIQSSKDEKWLMADLKHALNGNHFITEKRLDYPQYRDRYIQLTYNPIFGENDLVNGVAVFVSDITERKQYEAKLKALNEELTQQNWNLAAQDEELKTALEELSERNFELDQLMYKTSHDLRSPLSSIMGLVNLANLDTDQSNIKVYISKIEDRIKKLDEFIRSMLNYARANRAELGKDKIDLKAVALNAIHELAYLDNFKAIQTNVEIKNEGIVFCNDQLRVNIIFSNIISNAYKYYNPEAESYLNIKIELNPLVAKIEISDNGIGIRKEHLDKIFKMFYRATEKSQGSGLGMYIVKQAIEKLGGSVHIASEYGKGTTIKISLPNM